MTAANCQTDTRDERPPATRNQPSRSLPLRRPGFAPASMTHLSQHIIDLFAMDALLVKLNEACKGLCVLQVSLVVALNAIAEMGGNSGTLIEHAKQQLDRLAAQLAIEGGVQ